VNSATLASGKCHYCKAKQAILTSKTGTIPVRKWLRSDTTVRLFFSFRRTTLKILFTLNAQWHMELRVKVNSYFHKIFCVFLVIRNERGACPSDFLTDYTVKSFCLIISFHKCLEFYSIFITFAIGSGRNPD
jgi:hypothetical protein